VVRDAEVDSNVVNTLRYERPEENLAAMIHGFQNRVRPGPDREEAIGILIYFHQHMRDDRVDAGCAFSIAFTALDNKVRKEEAAAEHRQGGHP
jgi:hypothetical protein